MIDFTGTSKITDAKAGATQEIYKLCCQYDWKYLHDRCDHWNTQLL